MDIKTKSDEVMQARGWTQRRLAEEIGINETTLTNARAGRRPLPTQALIRLERLRGTDDHSIIEQLLRTAACVALAIVLTLWTSPENKAFATTSYAGNVTRNADYRGFWIRVRNRLAAFVKKLKRPLPRWGMLSTA